MIARGNLTCTARDRARMWAVRWALGAVLFAPGAPAQSAEGDGVRLTLTGLAGPFAEVTYEIVERRGAHVISVSKSLAAGFGHRDEVGLLTPAAFAEALDRAEALGAQALPTRTVATPRARWRWTWIRGAARHSGIVDDPEVSDDVRHLALIEHVRAFVDARVGRVAFSDVLLLPEEAGVLRVVSRPPAQVLVDGFKAAESTPLPGLRLPAGRRQIQLVPVGGASARSYDVLIEPGKTTSLVVDLD